MAALPREPGPWREHLDRCDGCREQWRAHRLLTETLGAEAVPELSPRFAGDLRRRLETEPPVRPLAGWRLAALVAYGTFALGLVGWALRDAPVEAVDLSAPWVGVVAFVAVPLSLLLALTASRWLPELPPPGGKARTLAI